MYSGVFLRGEDALDVIFKRRGSLSVLCCGFVVGLLYGDTNGGDFDLAGNGDVEYHEDVAAGAFG